MIDLEDYLEDNPGVSFIVEREYQCEQYHELETVLSAFERLATMELYRQVPRHVRPFLWSLTADTAPATPLREKIHRCSKSFVDTMTRIQNLDVPHVERLRGWDKDASLIAPYPHFYHSMEPLKDISKQTRGSDKQQAGLLLQYFESSFGQEYREADALFRSGFCTKTQFSKLFFPSQIITKQEEGRDTAFAVKSCSSALEDTIKLDCETWTFHGMFQKEGTTLEVSCASGPDRFPISSLGAIPLQFDNTGLMERLRDRGSFFWNCRSGGLVTSVAPRQGFEVKLVSSEQLGYLELGL